MGPRTTKITRERTGCLTCRARKKKCEQQRPICRGCERNGFLCEWPVINRVPQRQKKTSNRNTTSRCMGQCQSGSSSSQEPQLTDLEMEVPSPDVSMVLLAQDTPSTCDDSDAPAASDSPDSNPSTELSETPIRTEISTIFDGSRLALSKTFSPSETGRVWELCGEDGFHLLGHYLTRTSITMSGGFQKENPFLSHVMPMALSSDLVMQLVLTVSAMHRAVAMPADLAVRSQSYYHEALARFRNAIGDYIHDGGAKRMALAVGSLVLCFTEVRASPRIKACTDSIDRSRRSGWCNFHASEGSRQPRVSGLRSTIGAAVSLGRLSCRILHLRFNAEPRLNGSETQPTIHN